MSLESIDLNAKEFEECLFAKDDGDTFCYTCQKIDSKSYFKHKFYFMLGEEPYFVYIILCESCARTVNMMEHIQKEFYKKVLDNYNSKLKEEEKTE